MQLLARSRQSIEAPIDEDQDCLSSRHPSRGVSFDARLDLPTGQSVRRDVDNVITTSEIP